MAERSLIGKIIYYGPGLSGKTTNLESIFSILKDEQKLTKKIQTAPTQTDRTLFFDFLPINLGTIHGFTIKLQLYTVPGQVHYHETRKAVLKGADAVVFVADSQEVMRESNIYSLQEMKKHLGEHNIVYSNIPSIIQFNKRDIEEVMKSEQMASELCLEKEKFIETVATKNTGVGETLNEITKLLIRQWRDNLNTKVK